MHQDVINYLPLYFIELPVEGGAGGGNGRMVVAVVVVVMGGCGRDRNDQAYRKVDWAVVK